MQRFVGTGGGAWAIATGQHEAVFAATIGRLMPSAGVLGRGYAVTTRTRTKCVTRIVMRQPDAIIEVAPGSPWAGILLRRCTGAKTIESRWCHLDGPLC